MYRASPLPDQSVNAAVLRPRNEGRILATQAMSNVDATLTLQGSVESVRSVGSVNEPAAKPLQDKQLAV